MEDLFLVEPSRKREDDVDVQRATEAFEELRACLHHILLGRPAHAKEARSWLVNAVSGLQVSDPGERRRRYGRFLPGGSAYTPAEHRQYGHEAVQLLLEGAPAQAGRLLASEPGLLRDFFEGHPGRCKRWFGHFSMDGLSGFKHGARALALYSLAHRNEVWDLLVWRGKHTQAPVAVAQKPHYFCELDVPRTIDRFARDCPGFWRSEELAASIESGALPVVDPHFFQEELAAWLREEGRRSDALYDALCDFLEAGPWRDLCGRLLPHLPDADLLSFCQQLLGGSPAGSRARHERRRWSAPGGSEAAAAAPVAAALVFRRAVWPALGDLLLASACGCSAPRLLRLLAEDPDDLVVRMKGLGH